MNPGTAARGSEALSIRSVRDMRPVELGPWDASDLIRLVLCNLAGVILAGIGWYQASGQTLVRNELTWLEVGILGVAVAVIGNLMWVLGGRRHIGLARVSLLPSPLRPARPATTTGATPAPAPASVPLPDRSVDRSLVANARMTRYHRPGCPLVAGKGVSAADLAEHRAAGRAPCELCEP